MVYIHSDTGQEKLIIIPAQINLQIINLLNSSSAPTSEPLVNTFSKNKENVRT